MENSLILKQLDKSLASDRFLKATSLPLQGWVRTIRKSLGMTIQQLAKRLSVDPSRVVKIETAEPEGAVTLHTLQKTAAALGCRLVYAFVPEVSFESMVKKRAHDLAVEQVKRSAYSMDLEAQSVNQAWQEEQINASTEALLKRSWKHLWEE